MATQIASIYAKVGADTSQFEKAMGGVEGKLHGVGGILKGAFAVGLGAAVAGVTGLGAVIAKTTGSAMQMEQSVADISATMGLTADETQRLSKLITDLGIDPKLKVSATEAADAIGMLGQAGLSFDQIAGGAARATVLLANATGADMATAASVATDAMNLWKMDASNMTGAINGITGATIQSKFNIQDYALALAQAGGVGSALGVSFEDFNAVIAATASSFASGSDAGTSFKTFLQRLLPQTNEAADMMRDLGLYTGLSGTEMKKASDKLAKVKEKIAALDPKSKNYAATLEKLTNQQKALESAMTRGQSAFYTAEGEMKSMTEIAQILQGTFAGMTEQQQNEAMSKIFGTDAMRTALGLMNAGAKGIEDMKSAIGGTSAEDSAAKRMNTLSGSIEILTGNLEAMSIMIGEKFLPPFRTAVEAITKWLADNKDKILAFFTPFAEGFQHLINILTMSQQPLQDVLRLFGVWAADLWNWVSPELTKFWNNFIAWIQSPDTWTMIWNNIVTGWNWFTDWAGKIYGWAAPQLGAFWQGLTSWVTDPVKRAELLGNLLTKWNQFSEWATGIWNQVANDPQFKAMPGRINAWIIMNAPRLQPWIDGFAGFIEGATKSFAEGLPKVGLAYKEFTDKMVEDMDRLDKAWRALWGDGKGGEGQMSKSLGGFFGSTAVQALIALPKFLGGVMDEITGIVETLVFLKQAVAAIQSGDTAGALSILQQGMQNWQQLAKGNLAVGAFNPFQSLIDKMLEEQQKLLGGARAGGGPVSAGSAYLVGEKGPEWFVPGSNGSIVPNGAGSRMDLYVHGDSNLPTSREAIRRLAVSLAKEMNLSGAVLIN